MHFSNVPPQSSRGNDKEERTTLLTNISSNVDQNFFELKNPQQQQQQQQRKQTRGNYGSTQPVNGDISFTNDSDKDGTLHSQAGKGTNPSRRNNNYCSQRLLIESQSRWTATVEFLTATLFNTLTYGIWSALDVLLILTMAAYLPSKDVFAGAATAITITAMTVMSVASGMSSALETLISNAYGANKYSRDIAKYLQAATVVNVCLLFAPMAIFLIFFPANWLTFLFPGAGPASLSSKGSKGGKALGNEAMLFDGMLVWLRWSPLVMLPQVFAVGLQKFAICQQKPQVVTRSAAVSLVVLPLLLWLAAREPHRAFSSSSPKGLHAFLNALDVFGGSGSVLSFVAAITIDKTILLCVMVGNIIRDDELRANLWGYGRAPPPQKGKQAQTGNVWCSDSYGGGGNMANTRLRTIRRPENGGDKKTNDDCVDNTVGYNRVISNEEVDEYLDKMRATAATAEYHGSQHYPDDPQHYDDHMDFSSRRDYSSVTIGGTLKEEHNEYGEVSSLSLSLPSSSSSFLLYIANYLKVGYPSAIAFCIDTWTFELMTILSARCGPTEAAAWVLMQQLSSPFFALASGLSSAAAAIIGQCHGAGCSVRLVSGRYRIAIICSTIVGFLSFILLAAVGPSLFAYVIGISPPSASSSLASESPTVSAGHAPQPSSSTTPPLVSSAGGEMGALLLLSDINKASSSPYSHFSASRALQIGEEAMTLFALHIGTDVTFFAMQGVYRGLHLQALQARIVFVSLWVVTVPMAVFWGVLIKGYRATPVVPTAVEAVVGLLSSISNSVLRRNSHDYTTNSNNNGNNNNNNNEGNHSSKMSTLYPPSLLATGCVHGIVVSLLVGTTLGSVLLYVYLKKAEKRKMWLEDADEKDEHGNGTSGYAHLTRRGDDENDEAPSRVAGYCFGGILRQLKMQNGTEASTAAAGPATANTPASRFISSSTTNGTRNDKGGGISFGAKGDMLMSEMADSISRVEKR